MGIKAEITLNSPGNLAFQIEKALKFEVENKLDSLTRFLAAPVKTLVQEALVASPEYESLRSGVLREQFGIANPQVVLDGIVEAVKAGVQLTRTKASAGNLGGLSITILNEGFSEVMKVPGTTYTSASKSRGATLVPWLEWLLFAGDKVVLGDFEINTDRKSRAASRTGRAIMVARRKEPSKLPPRKKQFQPWRVPPEFAGTVDSNWLTRAMAPLGPRLEAMLQQEAERVF